MNCNDREKLVLDAIIDFYLSTGEAVGSRALVKKYQLELSPATIRNVMADLEEVGYISKVHSSSGRAPTTKGYKYYVETLLEIRKLSNEELKRVYEVYETKTRELERILDHTSSLLSRLSSYAGIVLEPDINMGHLKKLEFIHINDYTLLAVIITDNNAVKTKKIDLNVPLSEDSTKEVSKLLNELLHDKVINDICLKEIEEILNKRGMGYKLDVIGECFKNMHTNIYIKGSENLIPELVKYNLCDLDSFKLFSNKDDVKRLFEGFLKDFEFFKNKVNIVIGEELKIDALKDFSFIFSTYNVGEMKGIVGIIGPKRMEYPKMAGLVEHVAKEVSKFTKKIQNTNTSDKGR